MATKLAVLGDAHVPGRAARIPPKLLEAVKKFKPDRLVFTGDATSIEILKLLRALAPTDAVSGERDFLELPEELVFEEEGVKFGMIHGNQVFPAGNLEELENLADHLEVDVLLSGHSHQLVVRRGKRAVLINPGSCTGVPLPGEPGGNPSAILLEVAPPELKAKIVEIGRGGKVIESKVDLALESAPE